MHQLRSFKLLLLLVWVCSCRLAAAPDSAGGFPYSMVYSTTEDGYSVLTSGGLDDRLGTLLFGGPSLISFDGDRWTRHPAAGVSYIRRLRRGHDGRVWACGINTIGWFTRDALDRWTYHSLHSRLPDPARPAGAVWEVFPTREGAVFLRPEEILRWDGAKFHRKEMPGTRRLTGFMLGDEIYVHYRLEGLYRMVDGEPNLVLPQSAIHPAPDTAILTALPWSAEQVLLITGKGLTLWRKGTSDTQRFAPEFSARLESAGVTGGVALRDGRFAFGTYRAGILIMNRDGTLDRVLGEAEGIEDPNIRSLFVDSQGGLWVSTENTTIRIAISSPTSLFDERSGLASEGYGIIRSGGILAGFSQAGMYTLDEAGDRFTRSSVMTEPIHEAVDTPWGLVACGYRGAWLLNRDQKVRIHTSIDDVHYVTPSRTMPDHLIVLETRRAVTLARDGSHRLVAEGLPAGVSSAAEDETGRLWIGTYGTGVWMVTIDDATVGKVTPAPTDSGLPPVQGYAAVRRVPDGSILVIGDNGAWRKLPGSSRFTPLADIPHQALISASGVQTDHTLWVLHRIKPGKISVGRISLDHAPHYESHEVIGLDALGTIHNIIAESGEGGATTIWIGGRRGILRQVVNGPLQSSPPRAPILRAQARLPGEDVFQPIAKTLPYTTSAIRFQFASPEFNRRPQIELQTRIDGIDADWITAPADSVRELTAVRDGRYTFRVRAVSFSGRASEAAVFTFEVAPPWWRTPPAYFLWFAILLPVAYGVYRLRVRTLQRRNTLLEQKVRERTEELAEASAAKTMFVANMSHDIRNPLNGIVGLALALEDTKLDPRQKDIVATLRECTTYLSSLVDDVLDFASIEAGRFELRPGPYVPAELLNSVVTTLKAQAAERQAFITIETDPDLPPTLRGDAGRIQQILVNYLSNALKYAAGHIRISASLAPNSPGEVEFGVADEGAGISEADQATLFTKFNRLDEARRGQTKGTGLGLASCRLLADLMGGSVGVESRLGCGSRFYLRLPLAVATEPLPANADIELPPTSVLLVEDTDYNAMAATAVLARLGLSCDRARDGAEALRMFAEKRHNIVLLDRNLPDMDGMEVAQRMRELETDGLRSVLLAVTAYCTSEDRALCLKAGMDAFVGKPLTPEKLRRVLVDAGRQMLASSHVDAPAAPAASEINTTLLEYLAEGTEGGLRAQADRFLQTLVQAHEELLSLRGSAEPHALADAAHRILGHARMVGASRLSDVLVTLERAARSGDMDAFASGLPSLAAEVASVTAALRRRPGVQKV